MEAKQPTYFIVGAGVAGLSCARLLKKKKPKSKVIVFDACDNVGGRCYSFDDKNSSHKKDVLKPILNCISELFRKISILSPSSKSRGSVKRNVFTLQ